MNKELNKNKYKEIMSKYGILFVLIGMVIALSIFRPSVFLTSTNILNILTQSSIYGILALGVTFVIISKGIDISVGSVLAFSGVVMASLAQVSSAHKFFLNLPNLPIIIPLIAALLIGFLLGAVNGGLIAFTGIPAFIATLGMLTVARGMALVYTSGKPISSLKPGILFFGGGIGIIPVPVLVFALLAVISYILLNYTRFGKSVYAIGANIKAAEVSGVSVKRNLVFIYGYCGLAAGIAAIVFAGRTGSVHPGAATGYELTAIAATTIGGTSHAGGIGTIGGCVVGALIIGVLRNGLTLMSVDAYWQQIIEGCIIVIAVVIDMRKNNKKK
ncbi:MAG: ABC transporter permease [Lachnospirales bacterium]